MVLFAASAVQAQQVDLAFGVGTITGQPASDGDPPTATTINHFQQTISGGAYPTLSGDFLFHKGLGVGMAVSWRSSQNTDIFLQPYRPILYDFNAVYAPELGKKVQAELQGGVGLESLRFYTPFLTCGTFSGCTNFVSSNHFMTHVGGGLRFYVTNSIFIRPEAHLYFVRNNVEFSGPRVQRFAVSIGYSLKNKM
ncbi:MAG: hypothetical protein LAO20_11075 [Acidobacteriia bacterium]|nr:hypothetical protein [Terriglobia bacterium]